MLIKKRICDICGKELKRPNSVFDLHKDIDYYTIKSYIFDRANVYSKDIVKRKTNIDVCKSCMNAFINYINNQEEQVYENC